MTKVVKAITLVPITLDQAYSLRAPNDFVVMATPQSGNLPALMVRRTLHISDTWAWQDIVKVFDFANGALLLTRPPDHLYFAADDMRKAWGAIDGLEKCRKAGVFKQTKTMLALEWPVALNADIGVSQDIQSAALNVGWTGIEPE